MKQIKVEKRDGRLENYNVEKIHKVLGWATEGLDNVSISDIEMNAKLNLSDKVSTEKIHKSLIKAADNLTTLENSDYQYVAARLLSYWLRKNVWGSSEPPRLFDIINKNISIGVYDSYIIEHYSESEIHKIGKLIKHDRDDTLTYAGIQQFLDKYLIKDRGTGKVYETPQFAYMLIAMCFFAKYPREKRFEYVKKAYNYFSTYKINLPTPIIAGVRSKIRQFASCTLFDCGDSLDSIFATVSAVGKYSAKRAGIGLNVGRIRPINSFIRQNEVIHTGVLPFTKIFESTVKSTSQNGIRGASATVYYPFWNAEVLDVIQLKNNAGTDENRIRKMDYCIQFTRLFYDRLIKNQEITLFSPNECPELYDNFGLSNFEELYLKREADTNIRIKHKIKAIDLMEVLARERFETGRIYVMNIDTANYHNPFSDRVTMSNLCTEIVHPTKPISSLDDKEGEIGTCILSAINLVETKKNEIPDVCDVIVRMLDELIDYQEYAVYAAEKFTKERRSLGIGMTNLASLFAQNKLEYGSEGSLKLLHSYVEHIQYYLLVASNNLAKERGVCLKYQDTKYSNGWLPIDTYCKEVDNIVGKELELDWESLRNNIKEYGLLHSSLTAQMPCESSSLTSNSTNGIEPVRALVSYKKSKVGVTKQIIPLVKYSKYYTLAWNIKSNQIMNNVAAVIQKFFDMSISTNHYYNPSNYPDSNVPLSVIIKDILHANKMGLKTLYYANTNDGSDENSGCESGACAI